MPIADRTGIARVGTVDGMHHATCSASASEATALWRSTNLLFVERQFRQIQIIIIIIIFIIVVMQEHKIKTLMNRHVDSLEIGITSKLFSHRQKKYKFVV